MKAKTTMKMPAVLVTVALLIGLWVIVSPQSAFADDGSGAGVAPTSTADSAFDFNMSSDATNGTSGRSKANHTSAYVHIQGKTNNCRLYIDGGSSSTGAWINKTVNGYANATRTGKFRIMNYVKEHNYNYARLTSWANSGKCHIWGVWSPDSSSAAQAYPTINA